MLFKLAEDSPFGRAAVCKGKGETFLGNAPAGSYEMLILDVSREG